MLMCVHIPCMKSIGTVSLYTVVYSLHIVEDATPYTCHAELAYQIKVALTSSRKGSPAVRLEVVMDLLMFCGGLAHCGTKLPASVRQQPVYGVVFIHSIFYEILLDANELSLNTWSEHYYFCY